MQTAIKPARIQSIDALRGFALAGVAIVHMLEQYLAGAPPQGLMDEINSLPDQIVQGLVFFLFSGKFYAIFSILFGLSFSIQMDSASKREEDFSLKFLWRAILLLMIGYVHQLFYRGDILTIYAMLAPFLIPFHRLDKKWVLFAAGFFFLSVPRFITFFAIGNGPLFGLEEGWSTPAEVAYLEVIRFGSITEVFQENAIYGMKTKMNFQLLPMGRFFYTFGYFLLGLWLGKMNIFRQLEQYKSLIIKVLAWSAGAWLLSAILGGVLFSQSPQPVDFSAFMHIFAYNFIDMVNLAQTIMTICAFLLLYLSPKWQGRLDFFAPYGRMALTNYIGQSLIGTFLFFGWGLGMMGHIRSLYIFIIAIVLIALQTIASKYWLKYFKYGLLEWLWRSATYLKWQPLRKE